MLDFLKFQVVKWLMKGVCVDGMWVVPSKIVCIGRNYAEHIAELGNETPDEPVIFIKPNSAISERLVLAKPYHYEGEIALLIRDRKPYAVGFGLDLTDRQLQLTLKKKGLPWERAKAFDGSAAFSAFVPFSDDLSSLSLTLKINGELRQQGGVGEMIHQPLALIDEISRFFTLEDNDIVLTGTPKGVGELVLEDELEGTLFAGGNRLISHQWRVQPAG